MIESGSRWISRSRSRSDTSASRKVVRARVAIPGFEPIDVCSVHASWESAGLLDQVEALERWSARFPAGAECLIMAGDFNDEPTGRGYAAMRSHGFADAFAEAPPRRAPILTTTWGTRIDYIFHRGRANGGLASGLRAVRTRVVFDGRNEPVVSDHFGVLAVLRTAASAP